MSEAVTMPSLMMMTSIVSEKSLAMERQTDRHIDRQTGRQTGRQTHVGLVYLKLSNRLRGRHTLKTHRHTGRQTDFGHVSVKLFTKS